MALIRMTNNTPLGYFIISNVELDTKFQTGIRLSLTVCRGKIH